MLNISRIILIFLSIIFMMWAVVDIIDQKDYSIEVIKSAVFCILIRQIVESQEKS